MEREINEVTEVNADPLQGMERERNDVTAVNADPLQEERERNDDTAVNADPLRLLHALDDAKIQPYHFKTIVIAGMGFFTDAYDLFCISLVTKLLGRIYYYEPGSSKPGSLPPNVSCAVNGVALCGTLAGQIFFGALGDRFGRKRVYGFTLILMFICSIASGLSFTVNPKAVMTTLCFFRFWLGFGVGGDYPLSAVIMAEYANVRTRGAFIGAVFGMQGFGILFGGIVSLIVSAGFKHMYPAPIYSVNPVQSTVPQADYVWRIILMFGCIPAAITYYWRMKMPETPRFTALVEGDVRGTMQNIRRVLHGTELGRSGEEEGRGRVPGPRRESRLLDLLSIEFRQKHALSLLGTTSTWFLLDIAYYSQNLFQKDIFTAIGWIPAGKTMNALDEVYKIARAQTLIALCSLVPGYWVTVALVDTIGRVTIQLIGFFFMTVFMFALAIPYDHWKNHNHTGFVIMYAFTFFFANFGPNSTTFIIPAEIFPARFRSTCHGISAASGKAGAIIGAFGFLYAAQSTDPAKTDPGYPKGIGVKNSLIVLGVTNALGFFFTLLLPESKNKPLEELSGENREAGVEMGPLPTSEV